MAKLKAFANDKINIVEMMISLFDSIENIVGQGEMLFTNIFSFFNNIFKRHVFQGVKIWDCVVKR